MVEKQHNQPTDPYWPFPSKDFPLKPWTPKEIKAYAKLQREKALRNAQESPL